MNKYVKDMPEICGLTEINTLADVLKIQQFVFSLIPYTEKPFLDTIGLEKAGSVKADLMDVYRGCKKNEIGGWCGLNAEFFRLILVSYGVWCKPYNYGLVNSKFTHVCIIVDLDGVRFLLDPYFNRVYTYKNDFCLQFPDLIRFVQERKMDLVTSLYGLGKKKIQTSEGFVENTGQELETSVLNYFKSVGLDDILNNLFSQKDFRLLLLIKIPNPA